MRDVDFQMVGSAWLNRRPVPTDFGGPTDIPYEQLPPRWAEQPVISHFHAAVDRFAGKIAVDDGTVRMTYQEVSAAVDQLAARIADVTPMGGPVLASLENTAVFPVVFLACLMTGRPVIPLDPGYPKAQRQAIARECGAAAVIVGDGLPGPRRRYVAPDRRPSASLPPDRRPSDRWPPDGRGSRCSDAAGRGDPGERTRHRRCARVAGVPGIDSTAGVIYTSGSTGKPKGVAFSHRHLLASVSEYVNACHIGHRDRLLALASLSGASGAKPSPRC